MRFREFDTLEASGHWDLENDSLSADIRFRPLMAMNECSLTAIRPLPVIRERTSARAAYRHLGDGLDHVPFSWRAGGAKLERRAIAAPTGSGGENGGTSARTHLAYSTDPRVPPAAATTAAAAPIGPTHSGLQMQIPNTAPPPITRASVRRTRSPPVVPITRFVMHRLYEAH